jgi:hypothetical protein
MYLHANAKLGLAGRSRLCARSRMVFVAGGCCGLCRVAGDGARVDGAEFVAACEGGEMSE